MFLASFVDKFIFDLVAIKSFELVAWNMFFPNGRLPEIDSLEHIEWDKYSRLFLAIQFISQVWPSSWLFGILIMVGCVLNKLKPSELYILAVEKASAFGLGLFHSWECRAPRALSYVHKMRWMRCKIADCMGWNDMKWMGFQAISVHI